jgi:hypothetical protein
MVSFYGWTRVDKFFDAWRSTGFRVVGHLVFRKQYTSKARFLKYQHEQAYLLAKENPAKQPTADVVDMPYSGNKLHPTQKPIPALRPLTNAGDLVLDPFCGSGSTLLAAKILKRRYLGIELDPNYHAAAAKRLQPDGIRADRGSYPPQLMQASRPMPPVGGAHILQPALCQIPGLQRGHPIAGQLAPCAAVALADLYCCDFGIQAIGGMENEGRLDFVDGVYECVRWLRG